MPKSSTTKDKEIPVTVTVKNTGKTAGEEVVQLYISHPEQNILVPITALKGFKRVRLNPGESQKVTFTLAPEDIACVDENGKLNVLPGKITVHVGGCAPVNTSAQPLKTIKKNIKITGETITLD